MKLKIALIVLMAGNVEAQGFPSLPSVPQVPSTSITVPIVTNPSPALNGLYEAQREKVIVDTMLAKEAVIQSRSGGNTTPEMRALMSSIVQSEVNARGGK